MTINSGSGVIKSGIHFGDVNTFPFKSGDTTSSGEAARILIQRIQNTKNLYTCSLTISNLGSGNSPYRSCICIADTSFNHIIIVNDGVNGSSTNTLIPYNYNLNANFSSLSSPVGAVVIVEQVSKGNGYVYHGEVSQIIVLGSSLAFNYFIPAFAVVRLSVSLQVQNIIKIRPVSDTYITAGRYLSSSFENATLLKIGTSPTVDHSTTYVSLLQFKVAKSISSCSNAVILDLQVAQVDTSGPSILTVMGVATKTPLSLESLTWKSSSFAVSIPTISLLRNISA